MVGRKKDSLLARASLLTHGRGISAFSLYRYCSLASWMSLLHTAPESVCRWRTLVIFSPFDEQSIQIPDCFPAHRIRLLSLLALLLPYRTDASFVVIRQRFGEKLVIFPPLMNRAS